MSVSRRVDEILHPPTVHSSGAISERQAERRAEMRGAEMLRDILGEEAYLDYVKYGGVRFVVRVPGRLRKRTCLIFSEQAYSERGVHDWPIVSSWPIGEHLDMSGWDFHCIGTLQHDYPRSDRVLALALYLLANPAKFFRTAG
jgi:hypothetical protein